MAVNKTQRLYLAKGDKEEDIIYADTAYLPQHQYDGIRFLYRQFKKGKPGVILNDPPGYGKRIQTVLFLSALHRVITLPTLVLCTEGIEEVWSQQFRQWTNMGHDVVVQKDTHTKSMCVIGTLAQINLLSRREWGLLVVDDNNTSKEVLRASFITKFRIWLTSLDMKENLPTFSTIYKWLDPKGKFVIEDFQADKKPLAVYSNSIRLDAFMEDIVIRRRDAVAPLGKPCDPSNGQQVSRKNKDVTGTKIKKSKPLPDYEQKSSCEHLSSNKLANNEKINDNKENTEDFVVNIGNEGEPKMDEDDTDDKLTDVTSNNSNEVSNRSIRKSGDNVQERIEMDIDFNISGKEVPKSDYIHKSDTEDSFTLLNGDFINSQNIVIKYDSEAQEDEIEHHIPAKKTKFTNEIKISEDLFSSDIIQSDAESDKTSNHDKNIIDIDDILTQAY